MPARGKKAPKDPNAPKRPASSYFLFSNKMRPVLKQENPDKKVTELAKLISVKWKELPADEKKGYTERAAELKKEYNRQMEEYKKTPDFEAHQRRLAQHKQTLAEEADPDTPKRRKAKPPKDPHAPKRPQSAYFMWQNQRRKELMAEEQKAAEQAAATAGEDGAAAAAPAPAKKSITQIAKQMGAEWKLVSAEVKKPFEERAAAQKAQYQKDMEAYKGSEHFLEHQRVLKRWREEQDRKEQALADAAARKRNAAKKPARRSPQRSNGKRSSRHDESDEDSGSESEGSYSSEGSGGSYTGSDSGSYTGSESESGSEDEAPRRTKGASNGGGRRYDDSSEESASDAE